MSVIEKKIRVSEQVQKPQRSVSRKRQKSKKVDKDTSIYRLYVEFLPAFVMPRESMCYYSNNQYSDDFELKALKRRVLHGSCYARYKRAMLFHQPTGQCLSVWVPGQVEMSYESYLAFKSKNTPYSKSLLTALVIYKRAYKEEMKAKKEKPNSYIYSIDYDPATQKKDFDVALRSLVLQLTEGKFQNTYNRVIIYHGEKKHELARMSAKGRVTCVNAEFKKKIFASKRFSLPELGVYIKR